MKIWPFDPIARACGGQSIDAQGLRRGLEPLRLIRAEFGDAIDVALEFHGYWSLPAAIRIARAAKPLQPLWLEDLLAQDNLAAYRELASSTHLPLCLSERLMTPWQYRELVENRAARVFMPDLAWCGGFTAARKIAALAEAAYLPVAPHNCGGPVLHFASAHFAAAAPNLQILETVRRHYDEDYSGLVSARLAPLHGRLPLPPGPGLGLELHPSVLRREDLVLSTLLSTNGGRSFCVSKGFALWSFLAPQPTMAVKDQSGKLHALPALREATLSVEEAARGRVLL